MFLGTLWLGLSPDGMITGVSANSSGKDKFKQRMFKLMRTMFPPVMTQHFKIHFIEINAVEGNILNFINFLVIINKKNHNLTNYISRIPK